VVAVSFSGYSPPFDVIAPVTRMLKSLHPGNAISAGAIP
jgi:hypothetical protein